MNNMNSAEQNPLNRLHFVTGFVVLAGGFFAAAIVLQFLLLR